MEKSLRGKSLLIVTPSFKGGGAEKIAVNLANQYASKGTDVTLLAISSDGPYREQVENKVTVIALDSKGLVCSLYAVFKALRLIKPVNVLSVIRETNIFVGLSMSFVRGGRLVYREANTLDHIYNSPWYKRWVWYALMRVSYARADSVIANSKGTELHLLKSKILKNNKVRVFDNPVLPANVDELLSAEVDDSWLENPKLRVILNVGRLHKQKNHALLIKAFAAVEKKLSDARLIILGEGGEEGRLRKLSEDEGVAEKIRIIPFQKNPFPYYRRADVFVLSSEYEGFGNVIVEALSSGNPVISTNCPGGPPDILGGGKFGVLTEVGSVESLTLSILEVLEGQVFFEPSELIERAQEYSIDAISKKYWSLFEES